MPIGHLDFQISALVQHAGFENRRRIGLRVGGILCQRLGGIAAQQSPRPVRGDLGYFDIGRGKAAGLHLSQTVAAVSEQEGGLVGGAGAAVGDADLAVRLRFRGPDRSGLGLGQGELIGVDINVGSGDRDDSLPCQRGLELHQIFPMLYLLDLDRVPVREADAGLRGTDGDGGVLLEIAHRHQDFAVGLAVTVGPADRFAGPGRGGCAWVGVGDGHRDVGEGVFIARGELDAEEGRRQDIARQQGRIVPDQSGVHRLNLRAADRGSLQDEMCAVPLAQIDRGVRQRIRRNKFAVFHLAVFEQKDRAGYRLIQSGDHLNLIRAGPGVHIGRPAGMGEGPVEAGAGVVDDHRRAVIVRVGQAQAGVRDRVGGGLVVPVVVDAQLGPILHRGEIVEIDVGRHRGADDASLDREALVGFDVLLLPVRRLLHHRAGAAFISDAGAGGVGAEGDGGGGVALVEQALRAAGGGHRGHPDQAARYVRLRPGGDCLGVVLGPIGLEGPFCLVGADALPQLVGVFAVPAVRVRVEEIARVVDPLNGIAGVLQRVEPDTVFQRPE